VVRQAKSPHSEAQQMREFIANGGSLSGWCKNTVRSGRHKQRGGYTRAFVVCLEPVVFFSLLPLLLPCPPSPAPPVPHRPDADPAELSGDAQKERIAMYWQDRHGKAWGSLRSLLAGIDGDGRVQMAMNGGIYDKAYAPLGLYIEDGKRLTPVNRASGGGNFLSAPAAFYLVENAGRKSCIDKFKPSPPSAMRCSPARC
jgi:hypothetical protein